MIRTIGMAMSGWLWVLGAVVSIEVFRVVVPTVLRAVVPTVVRMVVDVTTR
jgi:hypothetical protein